MNPYAALGTKMAAALLRAQMHTFKRLLPFGDSITQDNSAYDTGVWQLSAGYAEQAAFKAGRFTVIGNAGVSGNTTAQMRVRFQADAIALKPEIILLMAGTNSLIDSADANATIAATMNDIEYMVLTSLDNGILPVIVTPPAKNVDVTGAAVVRAAIPHYYRLAEYYGLPLIDMFKITVDPDTGAYRTGYTTDGTHPSAAGVAAMSDYAASVLSDLGAFVAPPYLCSVFLDSSTAITIGPENLIQNGVFLPRYNQPVPYWNPNTSDATITQETATPGAGQPFTGDTMKYAKGTAAAGQAYALTNNVAQSADTFAANDVLVFTGRCKSSGMPSGAAGFTVALDFGGGAHARPLNGVVQDGDFLFSQELTVPATPGDISVTAFVQDDGSSYEFNNFTLTNKTKQLAVWQPGLQS